MRYAGMIKNDLSAGPGLAVSFFVQGCDKHCYKCHNPETWDFEGGKEFTPATMMELEEALNANGIKRHLSIMGGEPLHQNNIFLTELIIKTVRTNYPEIKIYLWTGYTFKELEEMGDSTIRYILDNIDCLIDGPYIDNLRDITLPMRGSRNQQVRYKGKDF